MVISGQPVYYLITPVRDEADFIGKTIDSVISQTLRPKRWVIVDDGSLDATRDIILAKTAGFDWITLISRQRKEGRHFGAKVDAFNEGYDLIKCEPHDFIGNLDGDVYFDSLYYERLIHRVSQDPRLGLAGGIICQPTGKTFSTQKLSDDSVAGAVQLFRADCFRDIGGYRPIRSGGIDSLAEIMVKYHGWKVLTFKDLHVFHPSSIGTKASNVLYRRYLQGVTHYRIGYSAAFETLRYLQRILEYPAIIGSMMALVGYFTQWFSCAPRVVDDDVKRFLHNEQWRKLQNAFCGR